MMSTKEKDVPAEMAPATKTDEILKMVDDQEEPEVLKDPSAQEDTYDEEEKDWRDILPPPVPIEAEDFNEKYEIVPVTPESPSTVAITSGGNTPASHQHGEVVVPDFSRNKTNVSRRLWEAKESAEKDEQKLSHDLVPMTKEFQQYRKKMRTLIRYLDEYQEAMRTLKAKRTQLFDHYAMMTKGTPIWDHVGKPLTPEQVAEIQYPGDDVSAENIELQSKSIMKVADEIESGSLVAFQQLAAMQDRLDELDYQTHIIDYITEWDDVVTSMGDKEIKQSLELSKQRDHYVRKVDRLRKKVNRIERHGARDAPEGLQQKLDRNEDKLDKADDLYESKANDLAVVLSESVRKGWIDLYPLIKNSMKFEVNRLSRESLTYGRLTGTLAALKGDYKDAIKETNMAPEV
ncbi:hypothetical protein IV203_016180 [Nitzschia inconspicua]|uniref:Uncharacterized protein n=1 Tax=Nitzschia inconspicua TaxID=303405 RepID=A0A9K3KQS1_9STRA|nr:hypothetical protein IV203_016180 [Nitzschia inconspicua]